MFHALKILHQNKRNTSRRTNEQNLSLCLVVSRVKWSAASLSLCMLNTWSAWYLDDHRFLFMKFQKGVFVQVKAKVTFTLFAKNVWDAFALRHLASPSFLLVDGNVIYIVVSHSFLRNHLCCCVVSFQFFTVKISSTKIDNLTLFVYTTRPSSAKAGEIKYLSSSRHSCLLSCKPTSLQWFR